MTVRFLSKALPRSNWQLPRFTDPPRVTVVTYAPSPYQVELLNEVSTQLSGRLHALYLYHRDPERHWSPSPVNHASIFLDDCTARLTSASQLVLGADLLVVNFYRHSLAAKLLKLRVQTGKPWCFWGERPGYTRWAYVGHWYRRVTLAALHRSRAPIWGIGQWAVDRYRAEFGTARAYFNVPYFSDLGRFMVAAAKRARSGAQRHFLFSGSLISRKGVDLVAAAFLQLATEFPQVHLTILGTGELELALKQQLAPCGERVRFAGFQPWETLPQFYADADVVVVPSRHDGWALVVPEGLASNAPVIGTTRMGAALELIRAGENGWLVKPGHLTSLLAALREAAGIRPTELLRMSAAAGASVRGHMLADGVRRFTEAVHGSIYSFYG